MRLVEICDADLFSTGQVNLYVNELCRIEIIISNIEKNCIERDHLVNADKQPSTTVAFGSFASVAVSSDNGETIKVEGLVFSDEFGFLDAQDFNLVFFMKASNSQLLELMLSAFHWRTLMFLILLRLPKLPLFSLFWEALEKFL